MPQSGGLLVPEPSINLPACRSISVRLHRFGIVSLEIVDGKSERECRGEMMRRRTRQGLALEKSGQKQGPVLGFESGNSDGCSAKALARLGPIWGDFRHLRRERRLPASDVRRRVGLGKRERRPPARNIRPSGRIVGEVLEDHRTVRAFEKSQCLQDDTSLKGLITRFAHWPPEL